MFIRFRFKQGLHIHFFLSLGTWVFLFIHLLFPNRIALGSDAHQTTGQIISLEEAIEIAIKNNPQLQSSRYQIDVAEGTLQQSRLYPNPVIEFLAEEMPTHDIGLNESQNLVSITQPIITGGKRGLDIRINEKLKFKNELERDAVILTVIANTKKTFYKASIDQEGFALSQKIETIAKGIFETEKTRFEAGEVPFTNVLRSELELSKAKNAVSLSEGRLQNSLKELQTVMGVPDKAITGTTGKVLTKMDKLSFNELKSYMIKNQPILKASRENIEIAESELLLEKRRVIPDMYVSAGYKRLSQEDTDTVEFGLGIPVPFFNRNQGNIQKGKALTHKAKSDNLSVYNELLFELKKNFTTYNVERQRIIEFRENILPKAEKTLNLITIGYKEGEFSYIDLLDAQRTWSATRVSYIESLRKLNVTVADIERLAVMKIGK
ncbi:MAG: TolC family protein [Candidatus Brocadiaceae bacterium]|nr:TolC family protein [Candidatus Brocadiaceae bacterium]